MPAAYAHYRYGQSVYQGLAPEKQSVIAQHRQLFDIGVHGPDILFYYRPISGNPVTRLGNQIHTLSGKSWFTRMWDVVRQHPDSGAHLAFVYGFLCHYTLDSACHGYINQLHRDSAFSHSQVESELDRYFMIVDGKDPMRYKPTGHLHPTAENAAVIADFFPELTVAQVLESLRTMVVIENLWVASNPAKRGAVLALARAVGKYDYITGLMRPYNAPAGCIGLLPEVVRRYDGAIPRGIHWIDVLGDMARGQQPWHSDFSLPFDPQSADQAPEFMSERRP